MSLSCVNVQSGNDAILQNLKIITSELKHFPTYPFYQYCSSMPVYRARSILFLITLAKKVVYLWWLVFIGFSKYTETLQISLLNP